MTNALNNNSILPALALYGNTVNYSFPLILILGREPNDEGNIENTIGLYDFDDSPRSAFWNRAYSFIHRHSEVAIKKNVIELNNSPIIFANAFPKAILNSEAAKIEKRAEVSQKEIEDHINSVFSFNLINRVNLIILSGLSGDAIFEFATRQIIHHAKRHNIQFMRVPYFGSRKSDEVIDEAVLKDEADKIKSITNTFLGSLKEKNQQFDDLEREL